jgi:hypothetical protein
MIANGHISNGAIVIDGSLPFPEGTRVTVSLAPAVEVTAPSTRRRVALPLVSSKKPDSRPLGASEVAELFNEA